MAASSAVNFFDRYSPATQALEVEQSRASMAKGSGRGSSGSIDAKLSSELFTLNFDDDIYAFPAIEWEANEDLDDSESIRSSDSSNSFLNELFDNSGSGIALGSKRGRNDARPSSRRLVRSKKIKCDLSSLARGMSVRSALVM